MNKESITLYYRQGSSDKVYQASIDEQDGSFVVNFAYGRRGSTFQTGCKTAYPVDYMTAKYIFDSLVKEKTAKGYTPGANGTPYSNTAKADRATGVLPQLLNPIDEAQALKFLNDPAYWLQEKKDGRRVILCRKDGTVTGSNRLGLNIAIPESVAKALQHFNVDCIIDGESIGDKFFAFDLLSMNGIDLKEHSFSERYRQLTNLLSVNTSDAIELVFSATDTQTKHAQFLFLREQQREGAVFKRHDAPYVSGRPVSGGSQLKFKFYATATCIVAKANVGKRSVSIEVIGDAGNGIAIGNVTIPANAIIPKAGSMIEVRYLYAFKGGSLYQPVFIGPRNDIHPGDCSVNQLKYRASSEDDEA